MKKESIVWSMGCLFISLLLMLPATSLAGDKKAEATVKKKEETAAEKKVEMTVVEKKALCKDLKSKCDNLPKTACQEFESTCKPKPEPKTDLNWAGNLLFKNLFLRGAYGYTDATGTTGIPGQSSSLATKIEMTETYGIGIAYADKPIVSNIIAAILPNTEISPELKDLVFEPIKLNAEVTYGSTLKTVVGVVTDETTVKTTFNVEISYKLPIDKLVFYLEKSTDITLFRADPPE